MQLFTLSLGLTFSLWLLTRTAAATLQNERFYSSTDSFDVDPVMVAYFHYAFLFFFLVTMIGMTVCFILCPIFLWISRTIGYCLLGTYLPGFKLELLNEMSVREKKTDFIVGAPLPDCQVIVYRRLNDDYVTAVGQGFFVRDGEIVTAQHNVETAGEYYVAKGHTELKFKVTGDRELEGPQIDLVVLQVPKGVMQKMHASPAKLQSRVLNNQGITIHAGGLRDDDTVLSSNGTIAAMSGREGVLTCGHTADTLPGFSGAPIFLGRKVVAIHMTSIPSKVNSGSWIWPALGDYFHPVLSRRETAAFSSSTSRKSSDIDQFMEYDEDVYIRSRSGQLRKMKAEDFFEYAEPTFLRSYEENQELLEQGASWAEVSKWADEDQLAQRETNKTPVSDTDSDDSDSTSSFVSTKSSSSSYASCRPEPLARRENLDPIPLPTENLRPQAVLDAVTEYAIILRRYNELKVMIDILNHASNHSLALRDQQSNFQLSSDIDVLRRELENASAVLKESNLKLSHIMQKSADDAQVARNWQRYRHSHADVRPPVSQQTQDLLAAARMEIDAASQRLQAIPERPRQEPFAVRESVEADAVISRYLPGFFNRGAHPAGPSVSKPSNQTIQAFLPEKDVNPQGNKLSSAQPNGSDKAPPPTPDDSLLLPPPLKDSSPPTTPIRSTTVAPTTPSTAAKSSPKRRRRSRNSSRRRKTTSNPQNPSTPQPSAPHSASTRESLVPPGVDATLQIEKLSLAQRKSLMKDLLRDPDAYLLVGPGENSPSSPPSSPSEVSSPPL
ncbi:hypothetical protein 1 [Beihai sobemo-like virus 16]|uniref:hypothetical protein 1 n=1 Tax=Beihai sobemo-like virus 16 TaxID=1922687 RepID=UPI00090986A5|nr:hypothetical protein 1 [Beihai sobemo-like virus 16]APG75665.1 hypothetical protein 1 [Beihai sobemo-like virus 16]